MNLIGLDIGTTTIGGVLYSLEEKRTLKTLVRDNSFTDSTPGEYTQDPAAILESVKAILDELIDFAAGPVKGCSLSAQMHGILYVDKAGKPVSPFYTWQNQRGRKSFKGQPLESFLSEKLGYPVHTGYGIVTHYSLLQDAAVPASASSFCNIGDFVCMHLAGGTAPVTDITLGASLGIADISTGQLSKSLKNLGLAEDKRIPRIVSSTEKLGEYRGVPVIQPLGDNQASFLGSVKEKENSLLLNYGTAGQISFYRESYASYNGFETRPLGNEGYLYAAFSLCGGKSYMIMADFLKAVSKLFTSTGEENVLKIMDNMDMDFSEDAITCLPLFLGERGGSDDFASFRNVTDRNFTPENMVKALVQGMVDELRRFYTGLPDEIRQSIETLVGAGNGIRKNGHLQKAAEQRYGKPVRILDLSEESCLGAVINAGKGVGIFKDYGEGAEYIVRYRS